MFITFANKQERKYEMVENTEQQCLFCKESIATEEVKEVSNRKPILVVLFACVVILIFASISSSAPTSSSNNVSSDSNKKIKATRQAVRHQQPAPSIEEIAITITGMTRAQLDNYFKSIKGRRVEMWQGSIINVDQDYGSGFRVLIYEGGLNTVRFNVTKDVALSLRKGQNISFSGYIGADSAGFDNGTVLLVLDKATIKADE